MMYVFIITIFVICGSQTIYCDIITLQHGNKISCVSSIPLPVSITPPLQQSKNLENIVSGTWEEDDWTLQDSRLSSQGPVTDKRWQDFATDFTNQQSISLESVTSLSFSVYNPDKLDFHIHGIDGETKIVEVVPKKKEAWIHHTVLMQNQTVFIFENNQLIRTIKEINDLNHKQITIKSNKNIYWKIHEYAFRVANRKTTEISSSVTFPPTGKSCVFLYTSLCKKCFLEVLISDGSVMINSTKNMLLQHWQQSIIIDIDPHNETTITFNRGKSDETDDRGFWGLDLRLCPDIEQDLGIYRMSNTSELNSTEHQCHILAEDKTFDGDIAQNQTSCSEVGRLGRNCDISCEKVLGPNFKNCEQHRICTNSVCACAWGYEGPFCEKSCQGGTWGLSCANVCSAGCPTCDKKTGECMRDNNTVVASALIITGLALLITMVIVFVAVYRLRRLRLGKIRTPEPVQDMMNSQVPLI